MKILITGNMGYVGPRVVRRLRAAFPEATLAGADIGLFAHLLTNAGVLPESLLDVQYFSDVRHIADEALRGTDAIVHLAGVSNDPIGTRFETVTMDINTDGSMNLARRAKAMGVTAFVFASSCSAYGLAEDDARTERSSLNPLTAYARSKVATEKTLEAVADRDFRVTCLRFATACGMSERLRLDLVLNDFVAGAVAAKRVNILSDGSPWRPLIDVDDMARAIEWALIRPRESGGDYLVVNAGRDEANYQVRQLAEAVATLIPGTTVNINENAVPDKRSYRVDFSLFRTLAPDHQPVVTLEESIAGLRDGLQQMSYRTASVQDSPLIRLRTISTLQAAGLLSDDFRWTSADARARAQVAS
jgi:nucleoside-diphosphate-sugar epimerase